jgi:protein TonB
MSVTLQDPDSRATRSNRTISIALIGPHIGRRSVVAKAVSSADGRTVREFATYPDKVSELPRLLAQNFDVVMIDLDSDQNYALQLVQEIAATSPANVIVYSSRNDPTLGMISTNAGASDFLPIPADPTGEDAPGPQPVPERSAPPRPVEVRPEPRLADGQTRGQQPGASRPSFQPSSSNQQNVAPIRTAPPAPARVPEPAPRSAAIPEWRPMPTPPPVQPQAQRPVQNQVQNQVQSPIQNAVPRPMQSPAQPVPPPVQQSTIAVPVQSPAQRAVPRPVASPVQTPVPVSPVSQPEQQAASVAPARTAGSIETDADVLELFKYGKGQVKDIKDPDELPVPSSKKWIFISAGAVAVIAVVLLIIFLRPSKQKVPAAQTEVQTASQPLTSVPTTTETSPTGVVPSGGQPIAKPSPAGAVGEGAVPDAQRPARQVSSEMMDAQLAAKSKISKDIRKTPSADEPPPGMAPVSMDASGGVKDAALGGFNKVSVVPVVSQVSAGVAEGMAIHKAPPVYPKIARESHISGTVVLGATINRSGMLENVRVISGSQMLRGAAIEAVKTWRYRPYMLNNQPVAVQTTINVVFSLGKD